jgi:hypothetical protein
MAKKPQLKPVNKGVRRDAQEGRIERPTPKTNRPASRHKDQSNDNSNTKE